MNLQLSHSLLHSMHKHALATYPNECCGFFFGKDEDDQRLISEVRPVANSKEGDQRRRFEISPLDYLKAEQYALKQGLELLGIYHSHPNHPAIPSQHDLDQAVSFFSYIIISVGASEIHDTTSWILIDKEFEKELINVKNDFETYKLN